MPYARAPDVLLTRRDQKGYLTRLDTGDVFEANPVALLVFEAAEAGVGADEVAARVSRAYPDVPRDEVARDVADVLAAFVARGLLRAQP